MVNPVKSAAQQGLPSIDAPFVDLTNGKINSAWFSLLNALWIRTGQALGVVTQSAVDAAAAAAASAAEASAAAAQALANAALAALRANNLSDLTNKPQARINLGLGTAAQHDTGDFATAAQGVEADNALQPSTDITVLTVSVGTHQVVEARQTGWTAPTGTVNRGTFNAGFTQTISNPPTQAEVQALVVQVQVLSTRLAALEEDLTTHGLIGP